MLSSYLPSAQFTLVVASAALAGILVWAADYITSPTPYDSAVTTVDTPQGVKPMDWEDALAAIQGEKVLTEPVDPATLESLRAGTETGNLTGTVARSLLLNLSEAKSQGLGSDFPTQERLVAGAVTQAEITRGTSTYTTADLTTAKTSEATLRTYGNLAITTLKAYPNTSMDPTLLAIGKAVETGKAAELAPLAAIGTSYENLAKDLLVIVVPEALAPVHLQIINNLTRIAALYPDLGVTLTDPLRGLSALKLYQSLMGEVARLFTNTAQAFGDNGILFRSDEPGSAWKLLLVSGTI